MVLFVQAQPTGGMIDSPCVVKKYFESGPFGVQQKIVGPRDNYYNLFFPPLLADVDGDGIQELITLTLSDDIVIIDPTTGEIKKRIDGLDIRSAETTPLAIVDVDNDGIFEFILATADFNNPVHLLDRLVCFNYDGSMRWISNQRYENVNDNEIVGTPGIADFNMDGIPEVYILNKIFNAQTGVLLASGTGGIGIMDYNRNVTGWVDHGSSLTIAANLDDNPNDLELAAGYTVYKVNIVNTTGTAGNSMTAHDIVVDNLRRDGRTILADINLDGRLDVIVSSSRYNNQSRIYIYTLRNGQLVLLAKDNPRYSNYRMNTPTVGDADKNGIPEIYVNNGGAAICYSYDGSTSLVKNWVLGDNDKNNYYFVTMYDFNNDGVNELIFAKDKQYLFYHNINNVLTELTASTEIPDFVPTATIPRITKQSGCHESAMYSIYYSTVGNFFRAIFVEFKASDTTSAWAPALNNVFQFQSHPLFRNVDGSVPIHQENHATFKNKKFNNTLHQVNGIGEDGFYSVPAASLTGGLTCIQYDVSKNEFSVDFFLHNKQNSGSCFDTIPVAFYEGNPENGGTLLKIRKLPGLLQPGDTLSGLSDTFNINPIDSIWMVINVKKTITNLSDPLSFHLEECDYTDNYFKLPMPEFQRQDLEICFGDSVPFHNQFLQAEGFYHHKLTSHDGCDSIINVLSLSVIDQKQEEVTLQACDSLVWNGLHYDTGGLYEYETTSIKGCDSLVSLALTIHRSTNESLFETACDSFIWNNILITQSGVYTLKKRNIFGCDSIQTLYLDINNVSRSTEENSTCNPFEWNGNIYAESGTYTYKTSDVNGCDSIAELILVVYPKDTITFQHSACNEFVLDGITYDESGIYTFLGFNVLGCDSVSMMHLTINHSSVTNILESACDSFMYGGQSYFTDGIYTFDCKNQFGCDSIVHIDLQFLSEINKTAVQSCSSFIWPVNGKTYISSGTYIESYTNVFGCDSIHILELSIFPEHEKTIPERSCTDFFWNETAELYTTSGSYTKPLISQFGCDSILILQLEIYPEFESILNVETTGSFIWDVNQQVYTESGAFSSQFVSQYGCDSIYYLNLTVKKDSEIYFPNIIKGSDQNCCFTGYSTNNNLIISALSVYDRSGSLVYFRENFPVNDPSLGWDGTFKGIDLTQGVYVWMAKILNDEGVHQTYYGDITLIKN